MEKYFKCNSCHQLIDDVFESECCGKLFCSYCIGMLVNKSCPHCSNKKMIFGKNNFAQRLLKNIKVTCKFGCGKKFPYEEMRYHLLICDNKEYFCSFDNCNFKGKKNDILKHLIKEHQIFILSFMEYYDSFSNIINKICKKNDKKLLSDEKEDETLVDFVNSDNFYENEFPLNRIDNNFRNNNNFDSSQDDDFIINQPSIRRFNIGRNFNVNDNRIRINYDNNYWDDNNNIIRNNIFNNNYNNYHNENDSNFNNNGNDNLLDDTRSDFN